MSRMGLITGIGAALVAAGLFGAFALPEPGPSPEQAVAAAPSEPSSETTQTLPLQEAPSATQHKWFTSWEEVDKSLAPSDVRSFRTSTKKLQAIYDDSVENRTTLYCGCKYDDQKMVDYTECGYTPRSDSRRSHRIEWEHMVPASHFGNTRTCWSEGAETCSKKGRKCCEKTGVDPNFFVMVSDLHNLAPAIGEVNNRRSHHPYGETAETDDYGGCDFDLVQNVAEPTDAVRGDVARAWLYMNTTFGMPLTGAEREMFLSWHQADPPSAWEKQRNTAIAAVQGNRNPWVDGRTPHP